MAVTVSSDLEVAKTGLLGGLGEFVGGEGGVQARPEEFSLSRIRIVRMEGDERGELFLGLGAGEVSNEEGTSRCEESFGFREERHGVRNVVEDGIAEDAVEGGAGEPQLLDAPSKKTYAIPGRGLGAVSLGDPEHAARGVDAQNVRVGKRLGGEKRDVTRPAPQIDEAAPGAEFAQPVHESPVGLRMIHGVVFFRFLGVVHVLGLEDAFEAHLSSPSSSAKSWRTFSRS